MVCRTVAVLGVACTLTFPACERSQPGQRAEPGESTVAAARTSGDANLPASARQILQWLPRGRAASGWGCTATPQVFGPDNLWEAIDGGAEAYVTYGVQQLVSVTCTDPALPADAAVEIYRMADSLGAFGVYAQERPPTANFVSVGSEGYSAPNVVKFWNGSFYVKLTAMKTDDRIAAALLKLAGDISGRIGPPGPQPAGVLRLPVRDQVPHSVKYLPRDILGQSYLVNGFEAQYQIGAKACRLVTASFDSADEATTAFARYRKFLSAGEKRAGPHDRTETGSGSVFGAADETFAGSDSFNGRIVAARAGNTIAVVLGAPSERAATDLLGAFLRQPR